MIFVDQQAKTTDNKSVLNLSAPTDNEKPTLSFSQLLKGVSEEKTDTKTLQNGALVLALQKDDKASTDNLELNSNSKDSKKDFSSLLMNSNGEKKIPKTLDIKKDIKQTEIKSINSSEKLEINPQITSNISSKDLKVLIKDAKSYLKNQILQSDGYKKAEIIELPKTIKGLVKVAEKLGIDISKITLEDVKFEKTSSKQVLKTEEKNDSKVDVKKADIKIQNIAESKIDQNIDTKYNKQIPKLLESKLEQVLQDKKNTKTEVSKKQDVKPEQNTLSKPEIKVETSKAEIVSKQEVKPEQTLQNKNLSKLEVSKEERTQKLDDTKDFSQKQELRKEVKSEQKNTPLFKVQTQTNVTTQQTLQAREFKVTEHSVKSAKQKADDTLKLLLTGEKAPKTDGSLKLTSDFSVATARVIAPSATTESAKSLESLLRGESAEQSTSKIDGLNVPKADSFEVKINEAKQMTKYLSQDVKQAIDNYKAPFTRIKVQLNPQQLGEVDLTVVQRGKNLHVNISSNNAAINALAMNANDLKVQLNNSGIQNATLNFNSGSSDGNGANGQQNQRQNQQASQEYNYFDNEEQNEEILSSLEIVVPNYA